MEEKIYKQNKNLWSKNMKKVFFISGRGFTLPYLVVGPKNKYIFFCGFFLLISQEPIKVFLLRFYFVHILHIMLKIK